MKKITCTLLLVSGFCFGAEEPNNGNTSKKNFSVFGFDKKTAEQFLSNNRNFFSGAALFFMGSVFRVRRCVSIPGAILSGMCAWNPKSTLTISDTGYNLCRNLKDEASAYIDTSIKKLEKRAQERKQNKNSDNNQQ